jgi:solute carrier family 8 (sodium/calcium exchanger)
VGGDEPPSSPLDWFLHIFSCPLKVACAFLPPADLLGGYPLFVSSIAAIGLIVFFVEESAQALSCAIGIAPAIAAITLVALGTSLPDTLASRSAALADKTADASVGNVNGSNAANIFMGLGVPWSAGAIYWKTKGLDGMPVPPELGRTLGFGVTVFEILAAICIAVFVFKRKVTGVELGGDGKWLQAAIYMSLWVTFLIFVSLYAQNITTFWD